MDVYGKGDQLDDSDNPSEEEESKPQRPTPADTQNSNRKHLLFGTVLVCAGILFVALVMGVGMFVIAEEFGSISQTLSSIQSQDATTSSSAAPSNSPVSSLAPPSDTPVEVSMDGNTRVYMALRDTLLLPSSLPLSHPRPGRCFSVVVAGHRVP